MNKTAIDTEGLSIGAFRATSRAFQEMALSLTETLGATEAVRTMTAAGIAALTAGLGTAGAATYLRNCATAIEEGDSHD